MNIFRSQIHHRNTQTLTCAAMQRTLKAAICSSFSNPLESPPLFFFVSQPLHQSVAEPWCRHQQLRHQPLHCGSLYPNGAEEAARISRSSKLAVSDQENCECHFIESCQDSVLCTASFLEPASQPASQPAAPPDSSQAESNQSW